MLEVRIAEMSRDTARRLGINLAMLSGSAGNIGLTMLNGIMGATVNKDGTLDLTNNQANALYRFTEGGNQWTMLIDALKSNGLVNVLAEPNLIAISGQKASFLAGGEFPYEVVGENGTFGVAWKRFGVELYFTPTVLAAGRIGIAVNPKVSQIGEFIPVAGKLTPKLLAREVNTTIELADGQSFAIAGLLQHDIREAVSKFPVLGDVPILGALFRSSQFQKNETELIVIATPHLVKPLDTAELPLPNDAYVEPNDFEFYLKGSLEAKPAPAAAGAPAPPAKRARGGLEGPFGHIVPE
jgi:pilus assembly protein CpaC